MKFVQITSCHVTNSFATQYNWILHALDDQGQLWERTDMNDWTEVPTPMPLPIPGAAELQSRIDFAITELAAANMMDSGDAWCRTSVLAVLRGQISPEGDVIHKNLKTGKHDNLICEHDWDRVGNAQAWICTKCGKDRDACSAQETSRDERRWLSCVPECVQCGACQHPADCKNT